MTTSAPTSLTLAGINRMRIAAHLGVDLAGVSRIFNPRYPNLVGSVGMLAQIAGYLGVSMDELVTFLREECKKAI